jgi:hypothetical protein
MALPWEDGWAVTPCPSIVLAQAAVIGHGLTEGHFWREVNDHGCCKMVILGAMKT